MSVTKPADATEDSPSAARTAHGDDAAGSASHPGTQHLRDAWSVLHDALRQSGGNIKPTRPESAGGLPFVYRLPDKRQISSDMLERCTDAGLLSRTFCERVYLCPECWSSLLWFREVCPSCHSAGLERVELIHHYPCACVMRADRFGPPGAMQCPKCRRPMMDVGVDYEYQPGEFVCVRCEKTSTAVPTHGRCGMCDARFASEKAIETDWFSYACEADADADVSAGTPPAIGIDSTDAYQFALTALARFVEERDGNLRHHVERVGRYSRVLLDAIAASGKLTGAGRDELIEVIETAAGLHDLGNVGVSDRLLLKSGPLNTSERRIVRGHVENGLCWLGEDDQKRPAAIEHAAGVIAAHHERWDGAGYPHGLGGEQIPIEARIVAVADAYDALVSRRPFRDPYSHDDARKQIERGAGGHFDPDVVRAFVERIRAIRDIAEALPPEQD